MTQKKAPQKSPESIIKDLRIRLATATRQKNKAMRDQWTAESHLEYYQKKNRILEDRIKDLNDFIESKSQTTATLQRTIEMQDALIEQLKIMSSIPVPSRNFTNPYMRVVVNNLHD